MVFPSFHSAAAGVLPGENLDPAKMPGHWLLLRLGKKVLRPGGLGLTRRLLSALKLTGSDHVVEFAPGLGVTARMALAAGPASYTAIERDAAATGQVRRWLERPPTVDARRVITGLAQKTGLPGACADVVYGEAMLTMQAEPAKREIVREAYRLLKPGGRYGIHELCLHPDHLSSEEHDAINRSITQAIRHRALPLTGEEWEGLLRSEGFEITYRSSAPMRLLEPGRLVRDEGGWGALRFIWRVARDRAARSRVLKMRKTFREHRHRMAAICLVARKPEAAPTPASP
ncbi:MAG TPA: methyltransferase domain-containing protein [Chthoniobacteraceae bacterium]|nr:methyltransferase domain-containing protein [Chthoniobacteraceae bacterium]